MSRLLSKVRVALALIAGGVAAAAVIGWYHDNSTTLPSRRVLAAVAATIVVFLFLLEQHRNDLSKRAFRVRLLTVFVLHCLLLTSVMWWLQPQTTWLVLAAVAEMAFVPSILGRGRS